MTPREYRDGETFPYRGRLLTLQSAQPNGDSRTVCFSPNDDVIFVRTNHPKERAKNLLWWYTAETWEVIRGLLPAWCKKLGVRPATTKVKYARTRWGSCSSRGNLLFNSRLAMLSPDVAEYIVVHELCHFRQMNHSPAFWMEVGAALPDYEALRRRLRQEEKGAQL